MAILSRVSQRALWLRRISSMPVSTSVGAEVPGKPRKHHGGQSFFSAFGDETQTDHSLSHTPLGSHESPHLGTPW